MQRLGNPMAVHTENSKSPELHSTSVLQHSVKINRVQSMRAYGGGWVSLP